jgi:hypothetical protein
VKLTSRASSAEVSNGAAVPSIYGVLMACDVIRHRDNSDFVIFIVCCTLRMFGSLRLCLTDLKFVKPALMHAALTCS